MVGHTDGRSRGGNLNTGLIGGVLDSIVNEVVQYVAQVGAVGLDGQAGGLDSCLENNGFIGFQLLLLDDGLQQAGNANGLDVEAELPAPFHAHRQDLLDHAAQAFQLLVAQGQIMVPLSFISLFAEVEQGIVGGIGHGDGRLQLVGDVVGEIGLHLIEGALPEDGLDQIIECESQQQHNKA